MAEGVSISSTDAKREEVEKPSLVEDVDTILLAEGPTKTLKVGPQLGKLKDHMVAILRNHTDVFVCST